MREISNRPTRLRLFGLCFLVVSAQAGTASAEIRAMQTPKGERFVSTGGLSFTPKVMNAITHPKPDANNTFNGGGRAALSHVEKAWDIVRRNAKDPRVSMSDEGDGVKTYVVDMNKPVGLVGAHGGQPLPASHVRLIVARDRYVLNASPTRGAHYTGETWAAPKLRADAHPGAALDEQQIAEGLVSSGANATVAARAAKHVRLGLPSTAKYGEANDDLRVRNGYVLSMNAKTKVLNWASWVTTKDDYDAAAPRSNDWRTDPTLGDAGKLASVDDYRGAGLEFHRGHMVRSGERAANLRENEKTFVLSNAVPQAKNNNIGSWNGLEEWVHAQADQGYRVYNQAGPVFSGPVKVLGKGVAVPTALFKVCTLLAPGETTITENTKVVAVMIPNNNELPLTANWADYRVSVADVERATGLRFFANLPASLADKLRAAKDTTPIEYVMPPHVEEELERVRERQAKGAPTARL